MTKNYGITVTVLKEGKRFIAYSPVIDLSTSGRTHAQALSRFSEAASVFFEEINQRGTVDIVLANLGWQRTRKQWRSPVVISQQLKNISLPAVRS